MADVNVDVQVLASPTVEVSQAASTTVEVTMAGAPGPAGASGDLSFSQAFTVTSSVDVQHNLGKFPSVTVVDSAGDEVDGAVDYLNNSHLVVSFSAPFSGVVYCN